MNGPGFTEDWVVWSHSCTQPQEAVGMAVRVSGLAGVALGSDYLGRKCPPDVQVGLAKVSSSTNGNRCPKGNSTQWPETCFGHIQK